MIYLGKHRASDHIKLNVYYCMLFSGRVTVMIKISFSVRFVSGYAHVFVLFFVVIVPHPLTTEHVHCLLYR